MGVWLVGGGRGSPGVSTTALALALTWPAERPVRVIEADPDGGTFAARAGVGSTPGLADLVPALRRSANVIWGDAAIRLGERVDVIAAPPTADESAPLVRAISDVLVASLLEDRDTDSIIDLGRLTPHHPLAQAVEIADRTIVVVRPTIDSLLALRPRTAGWASDRVIVATAGRSSYTHEELSEYLGVSRIESLPVDSKGADACVRPARFMRSALARAAAPMSAILVADARDRIAYEAQGVDSGPLRSEMRDDASGLEAAAFVQVGSPV